VIYNIFLIIFLWQPGLVLAVQLFLGCFCISKIQKIRAYNLESFWSGSNEC